jgi:hypothetical protein
MRNGLKQAERASAGNLARYGERLLEGELAAPPPDRVGAGEVGPKMAAAAFLAGDGVRASVGSQTAGGRFARAGFARRVAEAVLACADPAAVAALLRLDG